MAKSQISRLVCPSMDSPTVQLQERLLCGDLKGLQRMTRDRKLCDQAVPVAERVIQKYRNLSPVFQVIVVETVDRLLEKQK
jgi:hypothetical protein